MNNTHYAYAVAAVRTKENSLLDASFFNQLIESDNYKSAALLLSSRGYTRFEATTDVNEAMRDYNEKLWEEIQECVSHEPILNFLIIRNDFHNIKASIKCLITDNAAEKSFLHPCVFDADNINALIKSKKFDELPSLISDITKSGYELLTSTMDGQLFDIYIDTAYLQTVRKMASDNNFASGYYDAVIAIYDILTSLRLSEFGKTADVFPDAITECELIDCHALRASIKKGYREVINYIGTTDFAYLIEYLEKSRTEFERECDNYLIKYLDNAKLISFGTEPIIAYYFAKKNELKAIRMIMNCKITGIESKKIMERMREMYV